MIEKQTLHYYDWNDIEEFLFAEINNSTKDIWNVWLDIVYDEVQNDCYKNYWFDMILDRKSKMIQQHGEWVGVLFDAFEKLQKEVDDEKITIRYSWQEYNNMELAKKLFFVFCITYTLGYILGILIELMDDAGLFPVGQQSVSCQ